MRPSHFAEVKEHWKSTSYLCLFFFLNKRCVECVTKHFFAKPYGTRKLLKESSDRYRLKLLTGESMHAWDKGVKQLREE